MTKSFRLSKFLTFFADQLLFGIRGKLEGITKYKVNSDEKRDLCNWICQNATKDDFKDFEKVFEVIEQTLLK